ncbi:hypothetical protein C0993_005543 [Termitomyces sp. T159_Od127]|nr:hypothetical protein C0993_005543 [Termitomyces sp. T159_Od127]
MSSLNLTEIPQQLNPLAPMAFLNPVAAYQATIAAYVMVGSAAALIWDILIHVDGDFKLLFRLRIGIPTVTYFISRYLVAFFALLWLVVLGSSATAANVASALHIGPTNYCANPELKFYAIAAPMAFAINDTFVFLAISWRLLSGGTFGSGQKSTIKSVMLGEYLPAFSRALLQDGQVYYLEETISTGWLASQLGHLDLEVGKEPVKSPIHFLSLRATEHETDDSHTDWREPALRNPDDRDQKGADSTESTEKTESQG